MDDQIAKLRDIQDSIRGLTDFVLWAENDLAVKNSIEHAKDRINENVLLSKIELVETRESALLLNISNSIKLYGAAIHQDLLAVTGQMVMGAQIIKEAVDQDTESVEAVVSDKSAIPAKTISDETLDRLTKSIADSIPEPTVQQNTPIAGMEERSAVPRDLEKSLSLLCDSASDFFKAWSNPVNVGFALAVPIVGGLGVIFGTYYLVFSKAVDAVLQLTTSLGNFLDNFSLKGFVFGKSVPSTGSSRTNGNEELIGSIDKGFAGLGVTLSSISGSDSQILSSVNNIYEKMDSLSFKNLEDALVEQLERIAAASGKSIENLKTASAGFATPVNQSDRGEDEFRDELLNLLSSTVKVKIVEPKLTETRNGTAESADAFSEAVRPLIAGQIALNNMLESNLRRLTEAVASLRESPAPNDNTRSTIVKDTVNTSLSDESTAFILQESKNIRVVLEGIADSFKSFREDWQMAKHEKSASQSGYDYSPSDGD